MRTKVREAEQGPALPRLDPNGLRFETDAHGVLWMRQGRGSEGEPVTVKAAFPLTDPLHCIVVQGERRRGIGLIADVRALPPKSQRVLAKILERQYFLPRIERVEDIRMQYGLLHWRVRTDRGSREFDVRSRRHDVRWVDHARVLVRDVDGNRYEIADLQELDRRSRMLLEAELGN